MKYLIMVLSLLSFSAYASEILPITVTAEGVDSDGYVNPDFAFCIVAAKGHIKEGNDKSLSDNYRTCGNAGHELYAFRPS